MTTYYERVSTYEEVFFKAKKDLLLDISWLLIKVTHIAILKYEIRYETRVSMRNISLLITFFSLIMLLTYIPHSAFSENRTGIPNPYLKGNITTVLPPTAPPVVSLTNLNESVKAFTLSEASNLSAATFGGWYVYHVWQQRVGNHYDIFFAGSRDGGQSYPTHMDLSNSTTNSVEPHVGAFGEDVYVIWAGTQNSTSHTDIFFKKSTDAGITFGPTINLSKTPSTDSIYSSLLVDQNTGKVLVDWIEAGVPTTVHGPPIGIHISLSCLTRC